jgi:mRNA interferase MazF
MGRSRFVWQSGRVVVTQLPARGEVWWCKLPDVGRRPVVVALPRRRDPEAQTGGRRTLHDNDSRAGQRGSAGAGLRSDSPPLAVNLDSMENVAVGMLTDGSGPSQRRAHGRGVRCTRGGSRLS